MIVLNEKEWAEAAIENKALGKAPVETLGRVAMYYFHCQGYKKPELKRKLEDFLIACNPKVVLVNWSETLDRIVKYSNKYPLIQIDYIPVTAAELAVIDDIGQKQQQRLAFTFLCVAKYYDTVQEKNNSWVNADDRDIMKMANINTSVTRQSIMIQQLRDMGLIQFSNKVDNLNVRVTFIDKEGEPVLKVDDFRNLGNQYLMYKGEPFIRCAKCGLTVKKVGNAQKYCKDCASEMYIKKSVESVMRCRNSSRNSQIS